MRRAVEATVRETVSLRRFVMIRFSPRQLCCPAVTRALAGHGVPVRGWTGRGGEAMAEMLRYSPFFLVGRATWGGQREAGDMGRVS